MAQRAKTLSEAKRKKIEALYMVPVGVLIEYIVLRYGKQLTKWERHKKISESSFVYFINAIKRSDGFDRIVSVKLV